MLGDLVTINNLGEGMWSHFFLKTKYDIVLRVKYDKNNSQVTIVYPDD